MSLAVLNVNPWMHRGQLLRQFALRQFRSRFAGSMLGVAWVVLNPLMLLALYTFLFTSIFKMRVPLAVTSTESFALWLFAGLWPWTLFMESVVQATASITSEPSLVKRTALPAWVLPSSLVASNLALHLIGLLAFFPILAWQGTPLSVPGLCALVVPMAGLVALTLAFAWLLSALAVFLRDIGQVLGIALNLVFYLSPVLYPLDAAPEGFAQFLKWNPVTYIAEGYRGAIFHGTWLPWNDAVYLLAVALASLAFAGWTFRRLRNLFADVL